MTGFPLTAEQRQLRELAVQVAREVYAPKAAQWDLHRTPLPGDEVRRLAELGFLGIVHDEKYGGLGSPLVDALIVIEELAKGVPPGGVPGVRGQHRPEPGDRVLRHRGAEETDPAQGGQRRGDGGGGDLRARRRFGGHRHADKGEKGRRRVRHQRHQALDLRWRPRHLLYFCMLLPILLFALPAYARS